MADGPSVTPQQNTPVTAKPLTGEDTSGGRLLVVDDHAMNRDMLSRRLRRQGYTVSLAVDGEQALKMIRSQEFDLILLDIMMPGMNGYQVLEQMKADPAIPYIPVIMITAVDELSSLVRCIELGAEDYLSKPFNPVLLKARIGASLEKKRLRDQQAAYTRQLDIENRRKSGELERARNIQLAMLPDAPPQLPHFEIVAHQQTASEVGGDYYDFFPQPDGSLFVAVGDATGHGVGSGLMVAMTKASLLATNETTLPRLLAKINTILSKVDLGAQLNMALLVLQLVPQDNGEVAVRASAGGMPPFYILRAGGTLDEHLVPGFPLGIIGGAAYQQTETRLLPGDTLLLLSDGLMEVFNRDHEFLGIDRLRAGLAQIDAPALSATDIHRAVSQLSREWAGGQPLYDDITLVTIRVK